MEESEAEKAKAKSQRCNADEKSESIREAAMTGMSKKLDGKFLDIFVRDLNLILCFSC